MAPQSFLYDPSKDKHTRMLVKPLPDKLFSTLCRLTPGTRIYPMPQKSPHGGKWRKRYDKYKKAKTWGEYSAKANRNDIPYDVLRGIVRFKGPFRSECTKPQEAQHPADKIAASYWLRGDDDALREIYQYRDLFKKYPKIYSSPRTTYDMIQVMKRIGSRNVDEIARNMKAGERSVQGMARRHVDNIAKGVLQSGRKITPEIVLGLLRKWGYADNFSRTNVMKEGVKSVNSDNMGILRMRGTSRPAATNTMKSYANWFGLLSRFASDNYRLPDGTEFRFTSICLNKNYEAKKHKDKGNCGPSIIIALGDFRQGELNTWGSDADQEPTKIDIANRFLLFDGNKYHSVEKYSGTERFSIVYFTVKNFDEATSQDKRFFCKVSSCTYPSKRFVKRVQRQLDRS